MSERITFRHLGPEDATDVAQLPDYLFDYPVDPVRIAELLADPSHVMVMAYAGAMAVGMAFGNVQRHLHKQPAFYLNELGVRYEWQRQGIASGLSRYLFDLVRGMGIPDVWLIAEAGNETARTLYAKLGGTEYPGFVVFSWDAEEEGAEDGNPVPD